MKRIALLVAVLLVAGPVLAHGARTTRTKTVGDYEIKYFTYESITQEETIRLGWEITNTSSGETVDKKGDTVTFTFLEDGSQLKTEEFTIKEQDNGLDYVDLDTNGATRIEHSIDLPDGQTASFSDDIKATTENGGGGNGDDGGPSTPGFALVAAMLALGAGAALVTRRD